MGLYQYDSTEDKLKLVAGSTNFSDAPVGAIFPFGGTDIPISFLLCDGSAVSRTDYEDLFNVIGTAFGAGDGSTTFNLPDMRESVPKGAGLTGKTVGAHLDADGLAVGEFIDDRIKAHSHRIMTYTGEQTSISNVYGHTGIASNIDARDSMSYVTNVTRNGSKGPIIESTGSATTEVKSVGVNYIIKAKQIGMPTDFASAVGDIVVDKNTYSTSETIVGKWIDGKPIYRIVIEFVSSYPTVSIPNIENLVARGGFIATTGGSPYNELPFPWIWGSEGSNIYLRDGNTLQWSVSGISLHSTKKSQVWLEYTKTT